MNTTFQRRIAYGHTAWAMLAVATTGGCLGVPAVSAPELSPPQALESQSEAAHAVQSKAQGSALRGPAVPARVAEVAAWADPAAGPIPPSLLELRTDPDARVRAALLDVLTRRRHPEAEPFATSALNDSELTVRMAGVSALGQLGTDSARSTLRSLLENQPEAIRAAAVSALATAGAEQAVLGAAGDRSSRVRGAVAEALAQFATRRAVTTALQLIDDPSPAVQAQVLQAVQSWSLRDAGPVLLAALGSRVYRTRKTAAEQLATRWAPAAEFPADGAPQDRAAVLNRLQQQFSREVGALDPALSAGPPGAAYRGPTPKHIAQVRGLLSQLDDPHAAPEVRNQVRAQLRQQGEALVPVLEAIALDQGQALPEAVYREVLPQCDPAFGAVAELSSADVLLRRRAAARLAHDAEPRALPRLVTARLVTLMANEPDVVVWINILAALRFDGGQWAGMLAARALGHASPEVRRRACEHLAAYPDAQHAPLLVRCLDDSSPAVVSAALVALGALGRLDDTRPIVRLLADHNEHLRLAAAVALTRLGDPAGPAAVERLAHSPNPAVRRSAALAMGELAEPVFTAQLVALLDDRDQAVMLAALESLPRVVGHDAATPPGENPVGPQDRASRWKRWHQAQSMRQAPAQPSLPR